MKKISVLGSTGSIGKNTLSVAREFKNDFDVVALAAGSNIDLLEQQILEFHPEIVAIFDEDKAVKLKKRITTKTKVVGGMEGLLELSSYDNTDIVVSAISGSIGLQPTIEAIKAKKNVALANKEVMVAAGEFVTKLAKENNVKILPVDSEHSALFQCLENRDKATIKKIILTASGGPFNKYSKDELNNISIEKALAHPTWPMGLKNTIDSSTLMNKGLEVIEAYWLFDIPLNDIEVVIHPQSIVHSLVEFVDGAVLAQMAVPDMRIPIAYAMAYPDRKAANFSNFDFTKNLTLDFSPPDTDRFGCLALAYHALNVGGSMPCYMNAANEVLVKRFLSKEISWMEIFHKLEQLMSLHTTRNMVNLTSILAIDEEAKEKALLI
jgi:1-deoxy-D-xylulose-5-phosphate reductoisomerase